MSHIRELSLVLARAFISIPTLRICTDRISLRIRDECQVFHGLAHCIEIIYVGGLMRYDSKINFHHIGPAGHRQLQILVRCKLALSRENLSSGFPTRAC